MVLEPFESVVVVVAVVSGVWLWREWTSVATRRLNQSLFARAAHRRGQEATRSRLVFSSDRPAAEIAEALRSGLGIPTGVHTLLVERLFVSRTTPRAIELTFGSRMHTSFRCLVVMDDLPTGGSEGSYEVRTWGESHGLVNDLDQLQAVQRRILDGLAQLGATVAVAAAPERSRVAAPPRKRPVRSLTRPPGRRAAPARLRLGRARS
jgi:hypothetical protein